MVERLDTVKKLENPSFQLWIDFENVCDRYISLIDNQFALVSSVERESMMERAYLERTIILASRRDQRTFHILVRKLRSQAWYKEDSGRLSRYVALTALFPLVFEDKEEVPPGEIGATIGQDRDLLAIDHPYLVGESWSENDDRYEGFMDTFVEQMDKDIWGNKDPYDLELDTDELLKIQEVDLMFLEEALPILDTVRTTCAALAEAGLLEASDGAWSLITSKEHETTNMLARFVLECLLLRYLRSVEPKEDQELMLTWQAGIELGRVEMDMSPGSLDQALNLLIKVHGSDDFARGSMSKAAKSAVDLIGKKAIPIMVHATSISPESRTWPALMHDMVMLQFEVNIDPRENIRRMVEQGRRSGMPMLLCTTQFLKARCYEENGLRQEAARARLGLIDIVRRYRDEPDVLIQIPELVHLLLANKERSAAKKLLEVGLRTTASRSDMSGLRLMFLDAYDRLK